VGAQRTNVREHIPSAAPTKYPAFLRAFPPPPPGRARRLEEVGDRLASPDERRGREARTKAMSEASARRWAEVIAWRLAARRAGPLDPRRPALRPLRASYNPPSVILRKDDERPVNARIRPCFS
jgi:hypothetical protein